MLTTDKIRNREEHLLSVTAPSLKESGSKNETELNPIEEQILAAVRDLTFGVVEIVVHDRRVTEIRQTRRTRLVD